MNIAEIRSADASDAAAIAELVNNAYRPSLDAAGWTHESELVSGNRTSAAQVEETIGRPDSVVLVGLNDSEIVGCVHIEKDGRSGHIGMLAVKPGLQGAGAGKYMLARAENHAAKVFGAEKFILVAISSRSELIEFYLRRGYRRTGTVMDYPRAAGAGIPVNPTLKIEVLEKSASPG